MPMPHRTQMQLIKRRLIGKEGSERVRELRAILKELPGYRNGPYGDIRKWVMEQIEDTHVRSRTVHRDSIAVRREGVAQVALVGAPNAGKSSLLHALSHVQIKIGDYAFTTLRPVPALTRIKGVLVQLVEIPGLIEGAHLDRGGGRALLGVLRSADAIVYCQDVREPYTTLQGVRAEVEAAGIDMPAMLAATKMDDASASDLDTLRAAVPDLSVVGVSIIDDDSLTALKEAIWQLTGLLRVYLRNDNRIEEEPLALEPGTTIADVARAIHKDLEASFRHARVWGPSARFEGQQVGRNHPVADGDTVEIIA
ncbi:MAG: 50S ribosome-binding GTPase [Ktedonobacteraceae bacterium]|nr:50S ribosome-binding GTPase [Ktedonobacteraceae bacterium]